MFIAKYRLEKNVSSGAQIPARILEGGYYLSPIDNTMLGWYDTSESEFYVPKSDSIVRMTKQDVIDRALKIHETHPYTKNIDVGNPTSEVAEMTVEEVTDMMSNWCDTIFNNNMNVSTGYSPSNEEVNEERELRIFAGCNVTIANVGTIFVTGRSEDIRNMTNLGQKAILQLIVDDNTETVYRDGNNITYSLTPSELIELWQKSAKYISDLYQSSWALKANTVPVDFDSNIYWPLKNV